MNPRPKVIQKSNVLTTMPPSVFQMAGADMRQNTERQLKARQVRGTLDILKLRNVQNAAIFYSN